jgi:hypothetical protein
VWIPLKVSKCGLWEARPLVTVRWSILKFPEEDVIGLSE